MAALCAIHHKAFDKGSIGLDENMRVLVSDAVNGGGIVERLFWDFDGKTIALPQVRKNYPYEGFVEWHRKEVFRGEVDNYRSMFNIADIISAGSCR